MAINAIINADFTTVEVTISGLSGTGYDTFRFLVSHTLETIYYGTIQTTSTNFFSLPISILAGGTTYNMDIDVINSSTGDSENINQDFTVPNAIRPPGNITPSYYPAIKNQNPSGSCVAQCLTSAMEFFRLRGLQNQNYSEIEYYGASYLYGTDPDATSEEMQFVDALGYAVSDGSPRWEFVGTSKYDANNMMKPDAINVYNSRKNISVISNNALKNSLSGYNRVSSFYNGTAMYNALNNYGCLMFNFNIPVNFESDLDSTGIMPEPNNGSENWRGDGHCMLILGIKTINGKPHYIAQNSWGTAYGDNGYVYIPYDWASGIDAPNTSGLHNDNAPAWVLSVYSLEGNSDASDAMPSTPSISTITRSGSTARVSWTGSSYVLPYIYYNYEYVPTSPTGYNSYGSILASSPSTIYLPDASKGCQLGLIGYNQNTYRLSAWSDLEIIRGARPANWAWVSTVSQGTQVPTTDNGDGTYNAVFLTASEWNDFINRIKDFMEYLGVTYSIPDNYKAIAGTQMTPSQVNGIRSAVNYISSRYGTIPAPDNVRRGNTITAAFFNGLKDSLNSIP